MMNRTTASTGMATRKTEDRRALVVTTMMVAATSMKGARTMTRMHIMKAIWALVTSTVRRVIREAVEKRSILAKE